MSDAPDPAGVSTSQLAAAIDVAEKCRGSLGMDDAISAALIAFIEVLDAGRFDPTRGWRLCTFARKSMMGAVRATARAARGVIDTPEGKMPRIEVSLDVPISASDPDSKTLGSAMISGAPSDDVFKHNGKTKLRNPLPVEEAAAELRADRGTAMMRELDILDPRARRVIEARHLASKPKTQAAVALELGVSRQRVAQIERDSLHELRQPVPRELQRRQFTDRQEDETQRSCYLGRRAPEAILRPALPSHCVNGAWMPHPAIIAVAEAFRCLR